MIRSKDKIDRIVEALQQQYPGLKNYRWLAIKELEQDREVCAKYPLDLPEVMDRSYEKLSMKKFDFIDEIMNEVVVNKEERAGDKSRGCNFDAPMAGPADFSGYYSGGIFAGLSYRRPDQVVFSNRGWMFFPKPLQQDCRRCQ